MDKGFADADVIIERTYNSTQAQQCPTETHICFTRMDGDRLVIHASTRYHGTYAAGRAPRGHETA